MLKKCEYCGKETKNKRFCSIDCLNKWQKEVKWEDRVGSETAERIREERRIKFLSDSNPSKNPEVANKISKSLKKYLKENPRVGEKNPFYGRKHTEEFKAWAKESKKGKRSYNDQQFKKQNKKTPKKENHHAWKGGVSYLPYDANFDKKLKAEIKNRDNYKCQLCGEEIKILHIHHIDYNKNNSNEKNLITLCNSCHSKTNYKREEWQKHFEILIEEKYKEE